MAEKIKLSELENLTVTAQPTLSAGDVASQAASNFLPSAIQYGKDVVTPLLDPIGTAKSIGELGLGVIQLVIPGEQANEAQAKAVGAYFANRYGGLENLKKTIANDPAGFLGDASIILTGGAGLATKVGPASKAAQTVQKVAQNIDPVIGAVNLAGKPIGALLGTTTGAGREAVVEAYKAGAVGGERAQAFKNNMRGKESPEVVVDQAKEAMSNMATKRKTDYLKSMEGVKASTKKVKFDPIVDEINKLEKSFEFKGQTTLDKTGLNKLKQNHRNQLTTVKADFASENSIKKFN